MSINSEVLIDAVRTVVERFEQTSGENKPSIQRIADKCNSSYTTIRELKKGLLKNLSVKKALEISTRLEGPTTFEELIALGLDSSGKADAQELARRFSHLFDYSIMPESFDDLIANKDFSKIIWAAFSTNHITRDEIKYRWGKEGEDRLQILLEMKIVIDEDGIIKGVAENAATSIESAYKQLGIGYSLYNKNNSKSEKNWVSFQTNSVNDEFIVSFREDLRELFKRFHKKSNNPAYMGNKQMFFGMIFDKYLESNLGNEGRLQ